jgi:ubiquinone/menaquinone biosynthesis C-methylase UbiE
METGRFDTARGDRLNNPERLKELRPVQVIKEVAGVKPGMTCVDFGSGTGIFAFPMAEIVGAGGLVYAIDSSADMLQLIKSKGPPSNIKLVQADVAGTGLPDECADFCLCALILHEVDSPRLMVAEVWRVLKPGSKLIVIEWKLETDWGPPRSVRIPEETIKQLFKNAGIEFGEYIDWSRSYCIFTGKKVLLPVV